MDQSTRHLPATGLLLGLALLLAFPVVMYAQNAPPPPAQNPTVPMPGQMQGQMPGQMQGQMQGRMQGRRMDPKRQLRRLTRMLDLDTAQQQAILPILQDRDHQMQSLHKDQTTSRQVRRQQMRSIALTSQQKIKAVLNDTQKKQYDEMLANNRKRMQDRMQMRMQQNNMQPPAGAPQGPPANSGSQGPQ